MYSSSTETMGPVTVLFGLDRAPYILYAFLLWKEVMLLGTKVMT